MKKILCQLFLLGLPLLAFADEQPTFGESFGGSDENAHTWILYGHRTNKIAFVIFQTNHGENTNDYSQHIHLTLNTPGNPLACEGWIDMPDGTKQDLPSSSMVFECTDGVFHSAPIDLSEADFSRYIDSVRPKSIGSYQRLTVVDLKKFEKKVKSKSSKALEPTATAFREVILAGLPMDEASARLPRIGQYEEFTADDPVFDYLIYNFDGTKKTNRVDVATAGIGTIRRGGINHTKKMTLVIFRNLTSKNISPEIVYPFGLFLETDAIRGHKIPVADLAGQPFVLHPMNWDYRINEWVYTTNNATKNGPDVTENLRCIRSTNTLDGGWFLPSSAPTNRAEVYRRFGVPRYYVREHGTYSEVYPVDDGYRNQAGTARFWFDGDCVTNSGCYMTNK
jgi:hypothetical protein